MAITFVASGTVSTNSGGAAASPGLPAGIQAGDILECPVTVGGGTNNGTISFSGTGWTMEESIDSTTNHRHMRWWRRATGDANDTAPSIGGHLNDIVARISAFRGCVASGNPYVQGAGQSSQNNADSTTVTGGAITPDVADCMITFSGCRVDTGSTNTTFGSYSGTNPTFTEAQDDALNGGIYNIGQFLAYGVKNDTTSTGSRTATASDGGLNSAIMLALIPAAGGSSTTATPGVGAVTLQGKTPTTSAFQNVRIRQVLVNEGGQAVANAANITLAVWYAGRVGGAPDVSLNGQTTDAAGSTSWSIPTGTLGYNQPIFFVAQDSVSYSNYTCGRIVPSYE